MSHVTLKMLLLRIFSCYNVEETNIVVNYKDLVCAKKTVHFLGFEIGLMDGQSGFRKIRYENY